MTIQIMVNMVMENIKILSGLQFERMVSSSGPTDSIFYTSDQEEPKM